MAKYSIIVGLSTIDSAMNYHVSIFPTGFGGGAVPYKEYSTIEELWEVSKILGLSAHDLIPLNIDLLDRSKAFIFERELSDDNARSFGWPVP